MSASGAPDGSTKPAAPRQQSDLLFIDLQNDLARHRILEEFRSLVSRVADKTGASDASFTGYVLNDLLVRAVQHREAPDYEAPPKRLQGRAGEGAAWTMVVRTRGESELTTLRAFLREARQFGRARLRSSLTRTPGPPLLEEVRRLREVRPLPTTRSFLAALRRSGIRTPASFTALDIPDQVMIPAIPGCAWRGFRTHLPPLQSPRAWRVHVASSVNLIEGASSVFEEATLPFLSLTIVDHQIGLVDLLGTAAGPSSPCFETIEAIGRDQPGQLEMLEPRL
jgi:hypothetical protein